MEEGYLPDEVFEREVGTKRALVEAHCPGNLPFLAAVC